MAEYGTTFFKAKQMELVDKMDLASYLLKPVQRMGKYALLLQQLVKAGTDLSDQLTGKDDKDEEKDDEQKPVVEGEADLRAAEQMVRFQLRHGNDLLAMDSLRDCDVCGSYFIQISVIYFRVYTFVVCYISKKCGQMIAIIIIITIIAIVAIVYLNEMYLLS